jgi:hypothetical protein
MGVFDWVVAFAKTALGCEKAPVRKLLLRKMLDGSTCHPYQYFSLHPLSD